MADSTTLTPSLRSRIGTVLARGVVPAWILAGAGFKLWERNPQLLPKPVTDVTDFLFVKLAGMSRERYLDPAMRAMIAVEIAAALVMVFGPSRLARALGLGLLSLFCIILAVLIASGAASCGCFGASGPSPGWMLAIDGTLLLGLALCAPTPAARAASGKLAQLVIPCLAAGVVTVIVVPARQGVALPTDGMPTASAREATPPAPAPAGGSDTTAPATATTAPAPAGAPWPPAPARAKPWYAPEFEKWMGQRLDSQELALLVPRPLPVNLNVGRHHVVFMREDCEHCHALLNDYFSGPLRTPTVTIAVPDATGELLENPCTECTKTALPAGIQYVFTTPALLTVQDGVVVGVCTDPESPDKVRAALNAK